MSVHLIFDLGGTLIFDPFAEVLDAFSKLPLRSAVQEMLEGAAVDRFFDQWRQENHDYNFPNAGHFLQEEVFITRAAWPAYDAGSVRSRADFPMWTASILTIYRREALAAIARQTHLPELRSALRAARARGHRISVASNDRYGSTAAMLGAAEILDHFDFVATSEGLSFSTPGAEKPSAVFFQALLSRAASSGPVVYIGDDESRDIVSTKALPIRTVRYFGNSASSKVWLDNSSETQADLSFHNWGEFAALIDSNAMENG